MPISRRNFLAGVAAAVAAPALPAVAATESSVVFAETFFPTVTVGPNPTKEPEIIKLAKKHWVHDMDISSMYATPIRPLVFP